jgi:hypothetical protein
MKKDNKKDNNIKINEEIGDLKVMFNYISSKMDLIEGKYKKCEDFDSAMDFLNN